MPYTVQPSRKDSETLNKAEEDLLFFQWKHEQDDLAGNELVKRFTPLVHIIVEKIYKTLPKSVLKDELMSLGFVGLYEALEKYDPTRDLKFETYAKFRVRGSILDGLRKEDWLPRKTREKTKNLEKIIASLEQKYLRSVYPEEIAKEANLSIEEVHLLLDDSYFSGVLSIDDQMNQTNDEKEPQTFTIEDEKMDTPEDQLLYSEKILELTAAIKQLTEKEQIILSLIYKEELTLTEIGQVLDLSTSRISQIHSKLINKLRNYLQ